MSNPATRQRRTVPLEFSSHHNKGRRERGNRSVETEETHQNSDSFSAGGTSSSSGSRGFDKKKKKNSFTSTETRTLEPIRQSFSGKPPSTHSRGSLNSEQRSISVRELKREMSLKRKQKQQKNPNPPDPRTPTGHDKMFTIGGPSSPLAVLATPFQGESDKNLTELERVLQESAMGSSFSLPRRANSDPNVTPYEVRTPFEVDAPWEAPASFRKPRSSGMSVASEPTNPYLSEEQDAWAGIDALLETKSLDDSFTFSTSDILPKSTVKAMRRVNTRGSDDFSIWDDDGRSEAGESFISRRSQDESIKFWKKKASQPQQEPEHEESWNEESKDKLGDLKRSGGGDGGIFDMFQWSEKDNVDEQRTRKGKLNSRSSQKLNMMMSPRRSIDSDNESLPSLATFKHDDFSTCSTAYSRDPGSVVTEDLEYARRGNAFGMGTFSEESDEEESSQEFSSSTGSSSRNRFAGDGLVLDKGVDEYIRQIQAKLPTIMEDDGSVQAKGKKKKHVGFVFDDEQSSPSPTSVAHEQTAFDELPAMTGRSGLPMGDSQHLSTSGKAGRIAEKPDQSKPSLTYLMNSFKKKMAKPVLKPRKPLGDESKYFPDTDNAKKNSKKYSANRCLLSEGGDGVNWDAD